MKYDLTLDAVVSPEFVEDSTLIEPTESILYRAINKSPSRTARGATFMD